VVSCDETWSQLKLTVPASQLSWWVVRNYDNWRNSAVACIIFQDFPFNWQLVTNRFWKVSNWKKFYSGSQFYINQSWQCNAHDYCLREARWLINHIFDIQWSLPTSWCLEASACTFNSYSTATVTWDTFSVIFIIRCGRTCPALLIANLTWMTNWSSTRSIGTGSTVKLDDRQLHQCIRLHVFNSSKTVSFILPDDKFKLMRYICLNGWLNNGQVLIYEQCQATSMFINEIGTSRVQYMVVIKATNPWQ